MEDYHLKINRGNTLRFDYSILGGETPYIFTEDDVIVFSIYKAFELENDPVLSVEFKPEPDTTEITIEVPKDKMKFSPMSSMEQDYWYEITLNGETTLGFDSNGAKIITIYPEGKAPENGRN
jgi:hypothetical protein